MLSLQERALEPLVAGVEGTKSTGTGDGGSVGERVRANVKVSTGESAGTRGGNVWRERWRGAKGSLERSECWSERECERRRECWGERWREGVSAGACDKVSVGGSARGSVGANAKATTGGSVGGSKGSAGTCGWSVWMGCVGTAESVEASAKVSGGVFEEALD